MQRIRRLLWIHFGRCSEAVNTTAVAISESRPTFHLFSTAPVRALPLTDTRPHWISGTQPRLSQQNSSLSISAGFATARPVHLPQGSHRDQPNIVEPGLSEFNSFVASKVAELGRKGQVHEAIELIDTRYTDSPPQWAQALGVLIRALTGFQGRLSYKPMWALMNALLAACETVTELPGDDASGFMMLCKRHDRSHVAVKLWQQLLEGQSQGLGQVLEALCDVLATHNAAHLVKEAINSAHARGVPADYLKCGTAYLKALGCGSVIPVPPWQDFEGWMRSICGHSMARSDVRWLLRTYIMTCRLREEAGPAAKAFAACSKRCAPLTDALAMTMINMFAQCGLPMEARAMLQQAHENGLLVGDIKAHVQVLTAWQSAARRGCADECADALAFAREMPPANATSRTIAWSCTLDIYAISGDVSMAHRVFEEMQLDSARPDVATWGSLIKAHTTAGDIDGALSVLQEMRAYGAPPQAWTYSQILHAATAAGHHDLSLSILTAIDQEDLELDWTCRIAMAEAAAAAWHGSRDLQLLQKADQIVCQLLEQDSRVWQLEGWRNIAGAEQQGPVYQVPDVDLHRFAGFSSQLAAIEVLRRLQLSFLRVPGAQFTNLRIVTGRGRRSAAEASSGVVRSRVCRLLQDVGFAVAADPQNKGRLTIRGVELERVFGRLSDLRMVLSASACQDFIVGS